MGLLDDAIREHLDLKRRRGADPTEVERSEREALGPVRRTPERVPGDQSEVDSDTGPEIGPAPGAVYDDGLVDADEAGAATFAPREPDPDDPAPADLPPQPPVDRLDHSTLPGPAATEDDEPSWSYDEPAAAAEPDARQPDEAVPPPHRADSTPLHDDADHTAEYDVASALGAEQPPVTEHAHEAEHEDEDEDVLEETPEFLQDTPDHDRLWFEQRPPRDFDFDG